VGKIYLMLYGMAAVWQMLDACEGCIVCIGKFKCLCKELNMASKSIMRKNLLSDKRYNIVI
jgi:hypothetical protein